MHVINDRYNFLEWFLSNASKESLDEKLYLKEPISNKPHNCKNCNHTVLWKNDFALVRQTCDSNYSLLLQMHFIAFKIKKNIGAWWRFSQRHNIEIVYKAKILKFPTLNPNVDNKLLKIKTLKITFFSHEKKYESSK